ncbi:MAG TPA: CinA family nicotinamide mononucleotide deamidase-related protein [Pirellulales bacterium]|jgi:nicotinamide-nucleotide amidase|nr:CinA family nicotinamide mononucleotide deamidase-related protein [Pirellulales bacterium]
MGSQREPSTIFFGTGWTMLAEVISIGDELTSGQNLDTNCQWLSQRLGELGVRVGFHTTVADDLAANVDVFQAASRRADLVIATGGLGPTADDLTRAALAAAAGVELILHEEILAWLSDLFQRRGREMPERNRVQAYFPAGSRVISNPHGTAPGIDLTIVQAGHSSRVFALPGVPAEMKEMWEQTVAPEISALAGGSVQVIRHKRIKCFGVGESDLERMLPDLIRRGRYPQVGITVSGATITLRITAAERDAAACEAVMQPTIDTIHACLGTLVFGTENDELHDAVARLLDLRQKTVATAEWGTAGLVAAWLGETPQSAAVYRGGVVLTSADCLNRLLDLAPDFVRGQSAAGPELAGELARACRAQFAADFGLAIGPFPPLHPAAREPGQCHFALASAGGVTIKSAAFAAHPEILKPRAGKQMLNLLRLRLLESPTSSASPASP